jgi:diguanylate cyclase (GGDEF)-like protein/PAS domain S-box-containing protein
MNGADMQTRHSDISDHDKHEPELVPDFDIPSHLLEQERLAALSRYNLLHDESEKDFDHIARLAAHMFDAPIAAVSLVGRHDQTFKGRHGLEIPGTSRNHSFCHTDILTSRETLVVEDARQDPRFAENPFVTGDANVRFYAGAPLVTRDGHVLGRVCVIDTKPRPPLDSRDKTLLEDLATLAMDRLERRREERRRAETEHRHVSFARSSPNAVICVNANGIITEWNNGATAMFGYDIAEALGQSLDIIIPHEMRTAHHAGMRRNVLGEPGAVSGGTIELRAMRRDGSQFPAEITVAEWFENGEKAFGSIIRDVTQRKQAEDQLYRLAHFDPLTRIGNRTLLHKEIREALESNAVGMLLMIDLDGFKLVNDCYGHLTGDAVLREAARRIQAVCFGIGGVYRLGGDEFGVIIRDIDQDSAVNIASLILETLAESFEISNQVLRLGAGIGIAAFNDDDTDALLGNADLALYEAKKRGAGQKVVYSAAMRQELEDRLALRAALETAFVEGQFALFLQPQVDLENGALTGAEALLRWQHPERGLLAPGAFISELENAPIAADVGNWILVEACRQAMRLRNHHRRDIRIGVNLFAAQLHRGDLVASVERALAETGLPPEALELEITETIILDQDELIIPQLRALRMLGVGIAFDDYGTGWASLSLLKRYPLTRLKIDRSFVSDVTEDEDDAAIVKAVLALGESLGLDVIAEGIEEASQVAFLRAQRCRAGQGYLYGRPMPVEVLLAGPRTPATADAPGAVSSESRLQARAN